MRDGAGTGQVGADPRVADLGLVLPQQVAEVVPRRQFPGLPRRSPAADRTDRPARSAPTGSRPARRLPAAAIRRWDTNAPPPPNARPAASWENGPPNQGSRGRQVACIPSIPRGPLPHSVLSIRGEPQIRASEFPYPLRRRRLPLCPVPRQSMRQIEAVFGIGNPFVSSSTILGKSSRRARAERRTCQNDNAAELTMPVI